MLCDYRCVDDTLGKYSIVVAEGNNRVKVKRTLKVLFGIVRGGYVVNDQWISNSQSKGEWIQPVHYVHDEFAEVCDEARQSIAKNKKLLRKKKVFVPERGEDIDPSTKIIKMLAKEAGAKVWFLTHF